MRRLVAMVQAQRRVVIAQTLEPSCSGPDSENSCNSTDSGTERDWCALRITLQLGVAGRRMH